MKRTTTRLAPCACPFCGKVIDMHESVEGDFSPTPGDAAVCMGCCNICIMGDDMALRAPSDDEMVSVAGMPEVRRAVFWAGAYHANRDATDAEIEQVRDVVQRAGGRMIGSYDALIDALGGRPAWNEARVFGVLAAARERRIFAVALKPPAYAMEGLGL